MEEIRNLKFSEWPMFNRVMEDDPDVCRRLLEVILDEPVERVENLTTERALEPHLGARGIRMDVLMRAGGKVYDVEMQASPARKLGRRMRYCQATMDTRELKKGRDYDALPDSFIVFICMRDEIGAGLPIYHLNMRCDESEDIAVDHGFQWIVLNASAWDKASAGSLRSLLQYVANGKADGDELVREIDSLVASANADAIWRARGVAMLTYVDEARIQTRIACKEAREEGLAEGRVKGLAEGRAEGEERLGALVARLLAEGRSDDAAAAAVDAECRQELFSEFGL